MEEHKAMRVIAREHDKAVSLFPKMQSYHEGYAIILQEVDELWDLIKVKPYPGRDKFISKEASYIAAMALRFLTDLC